MKLKRSVLTVPLLALSLGLTACGGDSDDNPFGTVSPTDDEMAGDADGSGSDTDGSGTETDGSGADTDGSGTETDGSGAGTDGSGADTDGSGTDTDGSGTDTDGADTETEGVDSASNVIVATIASDYSSSAISIVNGSDPFTVQSGLNPGVSDTIVRAYEDNYYVIRRFEADSIAAYSISDPTTPLYEVSTNSDSEPDVSSNPHDLVFLNANKAYLLRYGSPLVWVVNPSATDASEFKIGEIDLSAYDSSGAPEATRGAIVGDKLYVVMQRLEGVGFIPSNTGYVAVIDTATDTEINTNTGELPGIEIPAINPGDISIDTASDTLYISAVGDYGAFDGSRDPAFTGGLVTVDTTDYSAAQLIDDNEGTGRINNVEIVSSSKGYLVTSSGSGTASLDQFNPMTGRIEALGVAGVTNVDVRDIAVGPEGNLWVAIGSAETPKIVVLNPEDNSFVSSGIETTLSPSGFAFAQ